MANLLEKANILITPTAYSDGKIHSAKPIQSLSAEKVVNGDFATDSGWNKSGEATISGGECRILSTAGSFSGINQVILEVGKNYLLTLDVTASVSGAIKVSSTNGGNDISGGVVGVGSKSIYFTSIGTFLSFARSGGVTDVSIDNISVKEVIDSDLNFTRGSSATRVNAQGLIENVDTLGSEAVVNGDFATDSGWGKGAGWTIINGSATCDGTNGGVLRQVNILQLNTKYRVSFDVINYVSGALQVKLAPIAYNVQVTGNGNYVIYTNGDNSLNDDLQIVSTNFNGSIDNVSAKEFIDVTDIPRINYKDFQYEDSLGIEEVVNGDFENGLNGWSGHVGALLDLENGMAKVTTVGNQGYIKRTDLPIENGKTYFCKVDIINPNDVSWFINGTANLLSLSLMSGNTYGGYVTASGTNPYFYIRGNNISGEVCYIDNVSVKEVTKVVTPNSGVGSWLIEPQSTNLVAYSEDFSQSYWNKGAGVTVSLSNVLAPNGIDFAYKISGSNSAIINSYNPTNRLTDTRSIWARTVSGIGQVNLLSYNVNSNNFFTVTEEWQRFEVDSVISTGASTFYAVDFRGASTLTEVLIWGGQAEEGNLTSYIPTNGSVQTRLAETASRSGLGDLIDSTEGVFYAELSRFKKDTSYLSISLSDGTVNNIVAYKFRNTDGLFYALIKSSDGSTREDLHYAFSDISANNKIAVKWKKDDFALWVNGVEVESGESSNAPLNLSRLSLDGGSGSESFNGNIKAVAVLPILTDEELECLTTR